MTDQDDHVPLFDATNYWLEVTKKLETIKPPDNCSFDFYMGFFAARREALRLIKMLD